MDHLPNEREVACRRVAQRAFVNPARAALSERDYGKALRLMAAGAVLSDDPSFLLDADAAEPHRSALWRSALRAVQESPQSVLCRSNGGRCFGFTADGQRVVGGTRSGMRAWDLETGAELAVYPSAQSVTCAALSPDGTKVIAGVHRSSYVWDVHTGKVVARLDADFGHICSVAFSPDGTRMLLGARDVIAMYDTRTGELIRAWTGPSGSYDGVAFGSYERVAVGSYDGVAFSADGTRVLACRSNAAAAWYLDTGQLIAELNGHESSVNLVAFDGLAKRAITGSHDRTVRVWDLATGSQIAILHGEVGHVALSPDGTLALTATNETARLWDVETGGEVRQWHVPGYVSGCAFSPAGNRVVVGSGQGTFVWETSRREEVAVLRGHAGSVGKAVFSSDGTRVLTGSDDGTARLWDAATGGEMAVLRGHEGPILDVAFSADGHHALTASARDARQWDSRTGQTLGVLCRWNEPVSGAVFSSDGSRLVVWNEDKTARIVAATTGSEIAVLRGHESRVWTAAFSPDGTCLVTGAFDRTARVWDVVTGALIVTIQDPNGGMGNPPLATAAFSPDNTRLLASFLGWYPLPRPDYCGRDAAILWDLTSGSQLSVLKHERSGETSPDRFTSIKGLPITSSRLAGVLSVGFSSDGARAITGSDDFAARVWDVTAGAEIACLRGHEGSVISVGFSSDGSRAVTASDDQTARVWDVSRWSTFTGDRAVYLAAALDGGVGLQGESERQDLLMQNAPEDLYAALMERLDPEQRTRVSEVSRRLRSLEVRDFKD